MIEKSDINVQADLSSRKDFEDGPWAFDIKHSGKTFKVIGEDRDG